MKIKVIDMIMGGGKSTFSHKMMYENKDKKYIYVTPYLDEIERLIGNNDNRTKFYEERGFREPLHLGDGKLENLHELLIKESNIATTHALLKKATTETIDLIVAGEYTLILDEALETVNMIDLSHKDYDILTSNNLISIDEVGKITWEDNEYEGRFEDFKDLCKNGTVVVLKITNKVRLLIWNFSPESFKLFNEIYILTYLFEGSLMKYYFDLNNIEYDKYTIEDNKLIPYELKKPYNKEKIRSNINIYEGNLNSIGDKSTALSLNWFRNNPDLRSKLKNNTYNYFKNIIKAKGETIIWTTFKSNQRHLSGLGYAKRFISCNTKATNDYKDCINLAYCCNRYISPDYTNYFFSFGVKLDEDLYALSELLQWIWRSAIREGGTINIYIPSSRMRNLLIKWLGDENI